LGRCGLRASKRNGEADEKEKLPDNPGLVPTLVACFWVK
jgi:hypothetical protein